MLHKNSILWACEKSKELISKDSINGGREREIILRDMWEIPRISMLYLKDLIVLIFNSCKVRA